MDFDILISNPIDMFSMLSQMTMKAPLFEMFRIEEHKNRALEWINGVGHNTTDGNKKVVNEKANYTPMFEEVESVVSKIPPMYLDSIMTSYVEDIDPFY